MLGIFTGLKITAKHFFGRKVTRLYPYEKRQMPPRYRGLIHYIKDENGQFKCEGCLLCEKVCPPQAITVSYRPRETHRDRPQTLPRALWANFTRSSKSLLSHQGRPELAADQRAPQPGEPQIDWAKVERALGQDGAELQAALAEIQGTVGHLPRHAVERVAELSGADLSSVYAVATGPGFPEADGFNSRSIAVCRCPACCAAGAKDVVEAVAAEAASASKTGITMVRPAGIRCLGEAAKAPVLVLGGAAHGDVTPESARRLVREFLAVGG